jgi:hypothetical protein
MSTTVKAFLISLFMLVFSMICRYINGGGFAGQVTWSFFAVIVTFLLLVYKGLKGK